MLSINNFYRGYVLVKWRAALRNNFTDVSKLADFLQLDASQRQKLLPKSRFTLNLPLRLAEKIEKGTLEDPILKQFVPLVEESLPIEGFITDPVGDTPCRKSTKLLKKYQGRALLVCTSACAMHCRYCFRQHFDYASGNKLFEEELSLVQEDPLISEVILSGGDPLSLDDAVLKDLLDRMANIPHIRKVRFHTRFPIGIPERIDANFLKMLEDSPLQFWFVVHANHARELDVDVLAALKTIQRLGIPVLNQSVLLRGVNDNVEVMSELCSTLVDNGIMPYYIHQLDKVQGAAHFEVDMNFGKQLVAQLAERLPGYAVPRYVQEIAGMPSKTIIF